MRTFYFIRHGQTDWNAEGRMQGTRDIPLNETGHAQARTAAAQLAALAHVHPIHRVVHSPQLRAAATAKYIADHLNVPLHADARLVERNLGTLEGLTLAEIAVADPVAMYDDTIAPDWTGYRPAKDSEQMPAVAVRGTAAIAEALQKYPEENILFVGHGALFRAIMYELNGGISIHSDNAAPYVVAPGTPHWSATLLA